MEKILNKESPKNLQTDAGLEFFNQDFKKLMGKYKVNHYNLFSEKNASIVERVNRTLKNFMWKEFNFQGHYKWLDILPKILKLYNYRIHRTIVMKPVEVTRKDEKHLLNTAYNQIKIDEAKREFKVGDQIRISKVRGVFDKKYMPNWTTQIFQLKKGQPTNLRTYLLRDSNNSNVLGGFYEKQLQKVKYPDEYLVEKIIRKKGDKVFVKWLGFDNKHNSWIKNNNVL